MDEEIRPPDQPIRECLLPQNLYNNNTYESEEDQLRRALEESETDFELQHAIILSRRSQEEKEERTKHVAYFKSRFIKEN